MFRALYEQYGEDYLTRQKDPSQQKTEDSAFPWPASFQNLDLTASRGKYNLSLVGRNGTEKQLDWEQLSQLKKATQNLRIISPQGWTYKTNWTGTALKTVLPPDIPAQAEMILARQTNISGETFTYPLSDLLNQDALLCYEVNGKALPALYGGPVWLMVFDRFSYVGMAQIAKIELLPRGEDIEWQVENEHSDYFWMKRQYSATGNVTPGNYYAFDQNTQKPVDGNGEIKEY